MNRRKLPAVLAVFCLAVPCGGLRPAHGQTAAGLSAPSVPAGLFPAAQAGALSHPGISNPAFPGEISLPMPAPGLFPIATDVSVPAGSMPPSLPAGAAHAVGVHLHDGRSGAAAAAQNPEGPAAEPSAASAARSIADAAAPVSAGMDAAAPAALQAASDQLFDGKPARAGDAAGVSMPEQAELGGLRSRVVMILDTLSGPVAQDDRLVQYIETLADKGARVVFVTARPEKGENSAESVLVSKLKIRTGNPVIVVSYNGARIAAHNSKAASPKPLIADQPGFAENTIAKFREIAGELKEKFGAMGPFEEFGSPSLESPYIYGARLSAGVDAGSYAEEFNRALRSAGLPYKMEAGADKDGGRFIFTQSTALRLNTGRIFNALYAAAPELNPANGDRLALKPHEVLILANPAQAPSFLDSLPDKGYFVHGMTDAASLTEALGAVLGHAALKKVSVNKYELRDYVEWSKRRAKYGASPKNRKARRAVARSTPGGPVAGELAFFKGIVIKELMGRLYHKMRKGAYQDATLDSALELLRKLWYYPDSKDGLYNIPPEVLFARRTAAWKAAQRGVFDTAERFVKNFYHRNFPDYPRGVSEKVAGRLLRLARDGDSVALNYASPHTNARYEVYVRPDIVEVREDDKGYILTGRVFRTGREPYAQQFDESVEVDLVGMALLQGDAQFHDGHWWVNGTRDPRVQVIFHYNDRDLDVVRTPAEIQAHAPAVTALIERRLNDVNYQAYLDQREADKKKALANIKRTATREANQKPAKGS